MLKQTLRLLIAHRVQEPPGHTQVRILGLNEVQNNRSSGLPSFLPSQGLQRARISYTTEMIRQDLPYSAHKKSCFSSDQNQIWGFGGPVCCRDGRDSECLTKSAHTVIICLYNEDGKCPLLVVMLGCDGFKSIEACIRRSLSHTVRSTSAPQDQPSCSPSHQVLANDAHAAVTSRGTWWCAGHLPRW